MSSRIFLVCLIAVMTSGCYHASITTGEPMGTHVIEQPWSHGFIYGLVPPSVLDASAQCTNGVAKVETELSFLNQLANALTFGLYSPMSITVTCAAGSNASVPSDSNRDVVQRISDAADEAVATGETVYVNVMP